MPEKMLSIRKTREVLRLAAKGLAQSFEAHRRQGRRFIQQSWQIQFPASAPARQERQIPNELTLTRRLQIDHKLDRDSSPSNHRLACQNTRIRVNLSNQPRKTGLFGRVSHNLGQRRSRNRNPREILREILGQPELTPFRLTNKEAEPSGTISCLSGCAKKDSFAAL